MKNKKYAGPKNCFKIAKIRIHLIKLFCIMVTILHAVRVSGHIFYIVLIAHPVPHNFLSVQNILNLLSTISQNIFINRKIYPIQKMVPGKYSAEVFPRNALFFILYYYFPASAKL